ncbi:hypothetical protein [Planktotalea arctica]|uniref:hypothetical protein n=1 Tax=Planktotalea arctica TaxID=1481893 RepID=UPI000A16D8BE|nr:hypothetical protein [Planktotalea arctica]
MIVAFDNTFLSLAFNPNTLPTPNFKTGEVTEFSKERVEKLIDDLSKKNGSVIVPSPCFSEMLCAVPDMARTVEMIGQSVAIDVFPFDARCAIELADINRKAFAANDKKSGVEAGWNQIKFDRQIAVVAQVNGAEIFYTDDKTQTIFAEKMGLKVLHTWDLDLPDKIKQPPLWEGGE